MRTAEYRIVIRNVAMIEKVIPFVGTRAQARMEARKHYAYGVGVSINFIRYTP